MADLDTILADKKDSPASGAPAPVESKADELKKKEEHLANINKAIAQANEDLKKARAAAKAAKGGSVPSDEENLPQIDMNDPGSKAWDKHFSDKVNPLQEELAKEKDEIRTFALKEFLKDKPNLANDADAIKRVMQTYDKIRNSSERTREGVMLDLDRAYAAEFHTDILQGRREGRIAEAQGDAIFSDPAVSRGDNSFKSEREKTPHLSKEDELILSKWGLTATQWVEMKKKQDKSN